MFDELLDCCLGDRQPGSAEMTPEEIEASLNPAEEGLVGMLFEFGAATCARTAMGHVRSNSTVILTART